MTSTTLPRPVRAWNEPDGVAPRGTLVLLTGRGEPPAVYERFGRRLSADAYRVRVVETHDLEGTRPAVRTLLEDDDSPRPKVLIGSDAGAVYAAALAAELDADALIIAGLATGTHTSSWEGELEARTACPAHRRVLAAHAQRGGLADELPELGHETPAVPTLIVHGANDPLTAPQEVFAAFPVARRALVAGGRHDVLNDVSHRSVAATIVLFLESLRLGPELPAIVSSP